jgi:NADH-quinone oxidoreductase subunit F
VDLRLIPGAVPTDLERAAIDDLLGPPDSGWDGGERRPAIDGHSSHGGHDARSRRDLLLPALHALQGRAGWISPGGLNYTCQRLTVPPAEAYGVATFYSMFSVEPRPGTVVHLCDDIACRIKGAKELGAALERTLGPAGPRAGAASGGGAAWMRSPCLGLCEHAPAVMFQVAGHGTEISARDSTVGANGGGSAASAIGSGDWTLAPASPSDVLAGIAGHTPPKRPRGASTPQVARAKEAATEVRLLRRVGRVDPGSLDDYRAHGGYAALRRALQLGPDRVIREVVDSKLMGRGGAAFPTGRKWEAVARQPARPHFLVCNADESEPGTFKDRVLMEEDPFALIEAMTIAAYATGCARGYIYIRGEYPLALARLAHAAAAARERGLLGADLLGSGLGFDLEIRRGAGAYICGEETALFNSIEGMRGEPRNKPPFPVEVGLFGKPTLINNVETLVNVLDIVVEGGAAFAGIGTAQSSGTKLFCVSGCVAAPGVYEVPFGTTLAEVLRLAGGVRAGGKVRAVLLGGAAGTFVTPDELDVPLTFEGTRAIGASLGSGVIIVFDETVDLHDTVLRIAAFFRDESCGQCVPCRVGTQRQEELLLRLAGTGGARPTAGEHALLDEIAQVMRDASICGLGHTAAGAAQSAIKKLGMFGGGG